jgi:hypothetical protein
MHFYLPSKKNDTQSSRQNRIALLAGVEQSLKLSKLETSFSASRPTKSTLCRFTKNGVLGRDILWHLAKGGLNYAAMLPARLSQAHRTQGWTRPLGVSLA